MNVMIYYTNGSTHPRSFRIRVNGAPVSTSSFAPTGSNDVFSNQMLVRLSGFVAGVNNTITIQGPGEKASDPWGPDLDFIEIVPGS